MIASIMNHDQYIIKLHWEALEIRRQIRGPFRVITRKICFANSHYFPAEELVTITNQDHSRTAPGRGQAAQGDPERLQDPLWAHQVNRKSKVFYLWVQLDL